MCLVQKGITTLRQTVKYTQILDKASKSKSIFYNLTFSLIHDIDLREMQLNVSSNICIICHKMQNIEIFKRIYYL